MRRSFHKRKPLPPIPQGVKPEPPIVKVLHAHSEYFKGRAFFIRKDGFWCCCRTSSSLNFLLRLSATNAKFELIKRGFTWRWDAPADNAQEPDGLDRSKGYVPTTPVNQQHIDERQDAIGIRVALPPARTASSSFTGSGPSAQRLTVSPTASPRLESRPRP